MDLAGDRRRCPVALYCKGAGNRDVAQIGVESGKIQGYERESTAPPWMPKRILDLDIEIQVGGAGHRAQDSEMCKVAFQMRVAKHPGARHPPQLPVQGKFQRVGAGQPGGSAALGLERGLGQDDRDAVDGQQAVFEPPGELGSFDGGHGLAVVRREDPQALDAC
ncbi:hypothetical protein [Thiocapsa marina]|uniref:Uncharacterized protein n=1 Tax=Thiocapsa marina 5811 TaxID=768671 RepID=F9UCQ3_9GAMM|nr:hypothetical protein [Thiocapsa marina]EGV18166.1 hypothetical protein ThimaDRAFT_2705 [Thiocapsa marina 5811]